MLDPTTSTPVVWPHGIKRVLEMTQYGLTVELWNGTNVSINFNPGEIHMHFSYIDYDKMLTVKELQDDLLGGKRASNYITVQYQPQKTD